MGCGKAHFAASHLGLTRVYRICGGGKVRIAYFIALVIACAGCGTTPRPQTDSVIIEPKQPVSDQEIKHKIETVLRNDTHLKMDARNIRIIAQDGVITVRGLVNDQEEKRSIIDKIRTINGVKKIENQLDVREIEINN